MYVVLFHCIERLTHNGEMVNITGGSAHLVVSEFGLGLLGYGHYAVIVFFVLSGYVIHLRQARYPNQRKTTQKWRWRGHYLWRRLARIYPPLLFAVLITLPFDWIGAKFFPVFYAVETHPHKFSAALATFIPTHSDRFGSNSPLWSIQYELLFYVLYAFVVLVIFDRLVKNVYALTIGLTIAGLGINFAYVHTHTLQPIWMSAIVYLPIWASGMLLAELRCKGVVLKRPGAVAAFGTLLIVFCAMISDNNGHEYLDYLWGFGIFLLLAVMMLRPPSAWMPGTMLRKLSRTSEWSYSVYLVHFPFLVLVQAAWTTNAFALPSPVLVPLVFTCGVLLGIAAWWIVERPSKWLVAHPPRLVLEPRPTSVPVTPLAGD